MGRQVAAMTIYDMCKALQRDILGTNYRQVHKSGEKMRRVTYCSRKFLLRALDFQSARFCKQWLCLSGNGKYFFS